MADQNFPRAPEARRAGLHAAFCFPIRSAGGLLGVMEFFTGEPRELDSELLATMSILGDQVGQAVERRRDAEALSANEARHRAMLDAALDCVVTMDHEGRVVDFNPAAERTFGYTVDEAVGRDMAELIIPPELRERHRQGLARYLETAEGAVLDRRIEITGMRADGSTFPVELTITRIVVPGPPKFTGYLRDITDRRAAEEEIKASRARIVEAADASRRRLERDLHDGAQSRLVGLALLLRLARNRASDPEQADLLERASSELSASLNELRELARGIHPAVLTDRGLEPALDALVTRTPVPVTVSARLVERLPPPVEIAAYFVVSEALTNVAKYAHATHATVALKRANGHLMVEVADDGVGGASATGGSGLRGLADRVAALDGTLSLDSPSGRGTRLRAKIPVDSRGRRDTGG
jgi:PAS domain S-box-containing protein